MKTILLPFLVIANVCLCFSQSKVDSLYLGKEFPGNTPTVFLAGSTERIAISTDGKDVFFNTSTGLSYYHYSAGGWSAPIALFTGYSNPSLSLNDSILYEQNSQPNACFSLKTDTGWSTPSILWNNSAKKHQIQVTSSGNFYVNSLTNNLSKNGDISKVVINGADISFFNLPFPINSKLNGQDFFMAKDESFIIFPEIIGGSGDLYISYKKNDTAWTNPKSLGSLINSTDWEYGPYLSPDNHYLFFSRASAKATYWVKADKLIDSLLLTNYIPYLNSPSHLENQTDTIGQSFEYIIPNNTFIDDDGNNTLTYSATLGDNSPLPEWISFDTTSMTFSGNAKSSGTFTIKITATDKANACASGTFTIQVTGEHSAIKTEDEQNIQIYPNPSTGKMEILLGKLSTDFDLEINDIQGKLIFSNTLSNASATTVDLTGNSPGIYFINLRINGEKYTRMISLE